MNKKSMKTALGVAALSLLASCSSTYAPNVDSTVSLKGTAIKAHDTTTLPEMAQLVEVIRQDRDVRFCPHGRPVSVTMTRSELERKFGRLV